MIGQAPVKVECKVNNRDQIMMPVQLSLPRSLLHPYFIPLYHLYSVFVHLHMESSDFLPCGRHHPSSSRPHQRKIEPHSTYWLCPTLLMLQLHKVIDSKQPLFSLCLLRNRTAFHRSDLAAKAHWQCDGHTRELPPDDEHHPRSDGASNPTEISSEKRTLS